MLTCGVKRKRDLSYEDLEEEEEGEASVEQLQKDLFKVSVAKLQQDCMRQGVEPRLLRYVLVNNAVHLLRCNMAFSSGLEMETANGDDNAVTSSHFTVNTFGSNSCPSGSSPCPTPKCPKEEDKEVPSFDGSSDNDFSEPSLLCPQFTATLLDRLGGLIDEGEGQQQECEHIASHVEVTSDASLQSASATHDTGTPPETRNSLTTSHGEGSATGRAHSSSESSHFGSCDEFEHAHSVYNEPHSDDSGLGESMDVPISLLDFRSIDLSLYDYDAQTPPPNIACLSSSAQETSEQKDDQPQEAASVPCSSRGFAFCENGRYTSSVLSPLVSVCRRSPQHSKRNGTTKAYNDLDCIIGLFVES